MKDKIALDDYVLFLAVAEGGGLSEAARRTGTSAPTLSRRMATLETQVGLRLFHRGKRGYSLTADGAALRQEAQGLTALAARLQRFSAQPRVSRIRITAGTWTSRMLARRIAEVWSPAATWVPEFLPATASLDIARRVADIGIRNRRPTQTWLAGQMTGRVDYAPFALNTSIRGWIALADPETALPSQRWVRMHHSEDIVTTTSEPRLALDLAEAGLGQVVLPLFAGAETCLVQSGKVISELRHEEWLVSHHDARHDPPTRAALDALSRMLKGPRTSLTEARS